MPKKDDDAGTNDNGNGNGDTRHRRIKASVSTGMVTIMLEVTDPWAASMDDLDNRFRGLLDELLTKHIQLEGR